MLRICLALVLFTSLLARVSLGQSSPESMPEPSLETVQKWFDQEWEQAQTMPDFGDCSISWTVEVVYVPPPAELKALARAVEQHPDHPDRWLLGSYIRRMNGQFETLHQRMWVRSNKEWRVNQTAEGFFIDSTITKSHAWRLSQQQLVVTNPTEGASGFDDIASTANSTWPELAELVSGGLPLAAMSGLEPSPVQLSDGQWRVTMTNPMAEHDLQHFSQILIGRWDTEADRGFIESLTVAESARTEAIGTSIKFIDWQWVEALDHWVASRAETVRPDGRPDRNLIFEQATCDSELTFKKVVRLPNESGGDVVRGPIEFRQIADHRVGIINETQLDGTVLKMKLPGDAGAPDRGWRRWAGVAVLAALSIGFILFYLSRRSAT